MFFSSQVVFGLRFVATRSLLNPSDFIEQVLCILKGCLLCLLEDLPVLLSNFRCPRRANGFEGRELFSDNLVRLRPKAVCNPLSEIGPKYGY